MRKKKGAGIENVGVRGIENGSITSIEIQTRRNRASTAVMMALQKTSRNAGTGIVQKNEDALDGMIEVMTRSMTAVEGTNTERNVAEKKRGTAENAIDAVVVVANHLIPTRALRVPASSKSASTDSLISYLLSVHPIRSNKNIESSSSIPPDKVSRGFPLAISTGTNSVEPVASSLFSVSI